MLDEDTSSDLPVMDGWPLVGHLADVIANQLPALLAKGYLEHGPVFKVKIGGQSIAVLAGPEANVFTVKQGHKVMRSKEAWRPNDIELGAMRSMISTDGPEHRVFRKVQMRAYSRSFFAAHLRPATAVVAEDLLTLQVNDEMAVPLWCKKVVTEQLARVVVGGTARPYLQDMLTFVQTALMVTVNQKWPHWVLKMPKYQQSKKRIFQMVDDLLIQHQQNPPSVTGRMPNLIDDVLAAQADDPTMWQHEDVRLAGMGAFIAGLDTAANSLAFVLYRMHVHRDWLPELIEEADRLFENGLPNGQALGEAKLLHQFIMETMRLHPIAPLLSRTLTQDITLAGKMVPKDSQVMIGTTVSHRLERLYPQPKRFDPERFSKERAEHRQPGAYVPFGVGAHTCGGSGLAEGLLMLNAAAILRTLELELNPQYRLRETFRPTACPDAQFKLKVRRIRHAPVTLLA